jgi:hypothetical protein
MPKNEDVDIREKTFAPLLATLGRPAVMDHRKPQTIQLHARHLRQALPQLRYIVVAVDRNEPSGVLIERVERGEVDPVACVDDNVCAGYLDPQLVRQHTSTPWYVGVSKQQKTHFPPVG